LAFDIMKKAKTNWAILTTADQNNAQRFLLTYGGSPPMFPLHFKKTQLQFKKSTRGQPDKRNVQGLIDTESAMRAKQSKQPSATKAHSSQSIFPFMSVQTGVWGYDDLERLIFDSKHRDQRRGTITFGRSAMVVYLAAAEHLKSHGHCRIDIPYSIIDHAIPSDDNGIRGTIFLTLRSPPKIYKIEDTDDLHLYTGTEPVEDAPASALTSTFRGLKLGPKTQRMTRETSIMPHLDRNSALCMVYRFVLPDITSAQHAWNLISKSSALSRSQAWKSTVPARNTLPIEVEYKNMERELDSYDLTNSMSSCFTFAVRFQLLALALEGTLPPATITQLIPHVQILCKHYGAELAARGVRKLCHQIPTPGPDVEATEFGTVHIVSTLAQKIRDYQVCISSFLRINY